jgi:hypothetical protein
MTLKPGESTTLSIQFMMHGAMGGLHNFKLGLQSNDPANKDVSLNVLSNWVQ